MKEYKYKTAERNAEKKGLRLAEYGELSSGNCIIELKEIIEGNHERSAEK